MQTNINEKFTISWLFYNFYFQGNIRVFCRVRPLLGEEIVNNGNSDVIHHINITDEKSLDVIKGGSEYKILNSTFFKLK